MKNLIKTLSVIALALMVAVPSIKASTVAESQAAIANLRSLTEVLPVTKTKDAVKIQRDLIQKLDKASELLEQGGINNYYKAALEIYDFSNKVAKNLNSRKISYDEGIILYDMGAVTVDCIVAIYCPECVYP